MIRKYRNALLAVLVGAAVLVPGTQVHAITATSCGTLAQHGHWPMDEPVNATTMADVIGGHDGAILYTKTGLTEPAHSGFGSFYRFGRGSEFPSGSIVTVPDTDMLDPGACDFAVDVSVNWDVVRPDAQNHTTYNVTQKGLSTAPANWKIEVDGGQRNFGSVVCTFDGADGKGQVRVRSITRVSNDGTWTMLRCERRSNDFIVQVNGGLPVTRTVTGIGPIENTSVLSVGAKKLNDSDTFPGDIDELVYWSGRL